MSSDRDDAAVTEWALANGQRSRLTAMSLPRQFHPATPDVLTQRQEQVAELRLHGLTLRKIAAELGVSHVTILNDMKKVRAVWRQNMTASYEEFVAVEMARYDQLARALAPGIERGDLKAIDTAIRLADRRARLLGLDSPQLHEVAVVTLEAVDAEIERLEIEAARS